MIKGYKGFTQELKCRDKQYEVGKEYTEPEAELCEKGLHFCEAPHHCFQYYGPGTSRFCDVEASGVDQKTDDENSKRVAKRLKIGVEIDAAAICKIAVKGFFEWFKFGDKISKAKESTETNAGNCGAANAGYKGAANAGNCGAANAGNYGAANAGNYGAANAGNCGAANAGNCGAANAGNYGAANAGNYGAANAGNKGAANAGNCGAANAGDCGAANAGNCGAANAGNKGAANAGDYGAANAGDCGAAINRSNGASSVGKKGVAICMDGGKAKGDIGALLVLAVRDDDGNVTDHSAVIVDGKTIRANTWYRLENGKAVECV